MGRIIQLMCGSHGFIAAHACTVHSACWHLTHKFYLFPLTPLYPFIGSPYITMILINPSHKLHWLKKVLLQHGG